MTTAEVSLLERAVDAGERIESMAAVLRRQLKRAEAEAEKLREELSQARQQIGGLQYQLAQADKRNAEMRDQGRGRFR